MSGEREQESALKRRLQQFLLELGYRFAFVGRQYHFEVRDQNFYINLLFFNWVQARFVVVDRPEALPAKRRTEDAPEWQPAYSKTEVRNDFRRSRSDTCRGYKCGYIDAVIEDSTR